MSEYQYYEFQAIDRPLIKQEMAEVWALSTRATITPTRFVNVYHWGDFKGDPLKLMQRYYDAFLYVANWGTHELMLRLPRGSLDARSISRYCEQCEFFSATTTAEHVILSFQSQADEPEDYQDDDGSWLTTFVPLRANIVMGDLRSFYLGWLLCVQEGALDGDEIEPPVPPGLGDLSGPLVALVDFLRLEDDLLEAAAERSSAMQSLSPSIDEAGQWLRSLRGDEKDELLLRIVSSDLLPLQAEVLRSIRNHAASEEGAGAMERGRTVRELLAVADRKRQERQRRAAQERERRAQVQAAERAAYVDSLAGREEEIWRQIDTLAGAKRPAGYAEAVRLMADLRELAARRQTGDDFDTRLTVLRARHAKKYAFLDRLNQAGLRPLGMVR